MFNSIWATLLFIYLRSFLLSPRRYIVIQLIITDVIQIIANELILRSIFRCKKNGRGKDIAITIMQRIIT